MSLEAIEVDPYTSPPLVNEEGKEQLFHFEYVIKDQKIRCGERVFFGDSHSGLLGIYAQMGTDECNRVQNCLDEITTFYRETKEKLESEAAALDEETQRLKLVYKEGRDKQLKQVKNYPCAPGPYFWLKKIAASNTLDEGRSMILRAQAAWPSILKSTVITMLQCGLRENLPMAVRVFQGDTWEAIPYVWNPPIKQVPTYVEIRGQRIPSGTIPDPDGAFNLDQLQPDCVRDYGKILGQILPEKAQVEMMQNYKRGKIVVASEDSLDREGKLQLPT